MLSQLSVRGVKLSAVMALTLMLLASTLFFLDSLPAAEGQEQPTKKISPNDLNTSMIKQHVEYLSGLGSRVTGYPGHYKAAQYIADKLREMGLQVVIQNYSVVVPVDEGSVIELEMGGERTRLEAFAIWPNGPHTSRTRSGGVNGHLIYVGRGGLEDFDGKDVAGSIVLMDYTSGSNWLNAARLGARGVIFTEPPTVPHYLDSLKKFVDAPLNFPRLYVTRAVGEKLIEAASSGATVTIHVNMRYVETTAYNVIGVLKGVNDADPTTMLFTARFDSWSAVPALSPGAMEAVPPALLLEIARYFSVNKPYWNAWFVFFSGHWQGLAGPRSFVDNFYFSKEVSENKFRPILMIGIGELDPYGTGLDLLRGSALNLYATTSNAGGITVRYAWIRRQIFTSYIQDPGFVSNLEGMTAVKPDSFVKEFFTNGMYWGSQQYPSMLDTEPAEQTRGIAFTIQSSQTSLAWIGTPISDYSLVDLERLRPQFYTIAHIIDSFLNERSIGINWASVSPSRIFIQPGGFAEYAGFIELKGKVITYNATVGWYRPVPRLLVRVYVGFTPTATAIYGPGGAAAGAGLSAGYWPLPYPFNKMMAFADENGIFRIKGLVPYPFIPGNRYFVEAWGFDEETGEIIYAPDLGIYGAKSILPVVSPLSAYDEVSVVVFRAVPTYIFDVIDLTNFRPALMPDPHVAGWAAPTTGGQAGLGGGWYHTAGAQIIPLNFRIRGDLLFYGEYFNMYEPVGVVFTQPDEVFMILGRLGGAGVALSRVPYIALVNTTMTEMEGVGFKSEHELVIPNTAYRIALDMYRISKSRYDVLSSKSVKTLSVEQKLGQVEQYLRLAEEAYANKKYSLFQSYSLLAWGWAYRAYNEVMGLVNDSSNTSLFFIGLIVLSSVFAERLVLHVEGRKRLLSIVFTGAVLFLIFTEVHPAFSVMSTALMAVFGLLTIVLYMIVLSVLGNEVERVRRSISYRMLGSHVLEIGRVGIMAVAYNTALENMRRRRLRTTLIIGSIIGVTLGLSIFTSVAPSVDVAFPSLPQKATTDGVSVRIGYGIPVGGVMGVEGTEALRAYEAQGMIVAPRAWYYPASIYPAVGPILQLSKDPLSGNFYNIHAILGLTRPDLERTIASLMKEGGAFSGEYAQEIIIPDIMAEMLGLKVGDKVYALGLAMKVVGIYSVEAAEGLYEISGFSMAPINPYYVGSIAYGATVPAQQIPPPLSWDRLIIAPYGLVASLGGYTASYNIYPAEGGSRDAMRQLSKDLSMVTDLAIYMGEGGATYRGSRVTSFKTVGWEIVPALIIIGALNTVINLMGSVEERKREIAVYSVLGLPPLGSSFLFLVESAVYACLGALVGYLIGFMLNRLFIDLNLLPQAYTLNYASIFIMLSLGIVILAAMMASIYPSRIAAMLVTPSLERKWKPPTRPKQGVWRLPLPLSIDNKDEAIAFMAFLYEYYIGAGAQKPSYTVREVSPPVLNDKGETRLELDVSLAPYEQGINQHVEIASIYEESTKRYSFELVITKTSGADAMWATQAYFFADDLRKQVLIWRAITVEERNKYLEAAKGLIKEQ
ncbi:MAG: FtsX-like permease family protein [Nitrososphaerota archaeon]